MTATPDDMPEQGEGRVRIAEEIALWHDAQERLAAARQSTAELIGGNASQFNLDREMHRDMAALIRLLPTPGSIGTGGER